MTETRIEASNGAVAQRARAASWLGVAAIGLAATLPFLGKAFHIDDPLYIAVARQILRDPLDPYGAEILWEKAPESLFDADFNPPLWSYAIAAVLAVTGEPRVTVVPAGTRLDGTPQFRAEPTSRAPEIGLHILESVAVAAAIVMLYLLSRRWVRWPLAATALVTFSPALLPGQNVMLEGPVLACWLGAVWCHLRALDTGQARWTAATGVLTALAILTKYTSALVIAVLVFESLRRRNWRSLGFVLAPLLAIVLWSLHNWFVYERLHVLTIFSRAQTGGREPMGVRLGESWGRLFALFRATGAITALAVPVAVTLLRRAGFWVTMLLVAASVAAAWVGKADMAARLIDRDGRDADKVFPEHVAEHVMVFGSLGAFTLAGLVLGIRFAAESRAESPDGTTRDTPMLWFWLAAVMVFGIAATPFLAVRHLVPGLPPMVWLVLRQLETAAPAASNRYVVAATVLITGSFGFLVAKADYDWANWYRHLAVDVASRVVVAGQTRDKTVWYTGHWGWQYYADLAGMKPYLPGRTRMGEGDFLLMPLVQTWQLPPQEYYPYLQGLMQPIQPKPKRIDWSGVPAIDDVLSKLLNSVRSISNEVHLHGCGTVSIPWQLSEKPLEYFTVIEVKEDPEASGRKD